MSPRRGLHLQTILHAAVEIADQEGAEAVSLATLAKKLSIRPPSLYNHVSGLTGLHRELALYGMKKLYEQLSQAANSRLKEEAIQAIAKAYLSFVRAHPGLYELTIKAPDPSDIEMQAEGKKIVDLAAETLTDYGLQQAEVIHAIRGLRSILHGFASLEQKGGFGLNLEVEQSLHIIIESYLAGIEKMKTNLKG